MMRIQAGLHWSVLILLTTLAACADDPPVAPPAPTDVEIDGQWPIAAPGTEGVDLQVLSSLVSDVQNVPNHEVHALLLVRHGKIVFEQYFTGHEYDFAGPNFHAGLVDWDIDKRHIIGSVTKAVTGMIVGIAVAEGDVPVIETPVLDFFPQYADLRSPEKDAITLQHLMTMSSGLQWDQTSTPFSDPTNDMNRFHAAQDPLRMVLSRPVVATPGTAFTYNGGGTNLLGAAVARSVGMSFFTYGKAHLFAPLGITDVSWETVAGFDYVSGNLRLRPRDLAKLGYLYLNNGEWNGRQIIPKAWIDMTTQVYLEENLPGRKFGYGHGWEVSELAGQRAYFHRGFGGQGLFVFPGLDMVFVMTSGNWIKAPTGLGPPQVVENYILPAVK